MLTTEQLSKRSLSLGASDIAAVCGVSPYHTAEEVWREKVHGRGSRDQRLDDLAEWGDLLEGPIREWYSRRLPGGHFVTVPSTLYHPENNWATATPDGVVYVPGVGDYGEYGLEIKNRGYGDKPRWIDHVPCETAAQCHWGMYVTGLDRWDVVGLVNGNTPFVHTLERDEELLRAMVVVGEWVWKAIQAKTAPEMGWVAEEIVQIWNKLVNDADVTAFRRAAWWRRKDQREATKC